MTVRLLWHTLIHPPTAPQALEMCHFLHLYLAFEVRLVAVAEAYSICTALCTQIKITATDFTMFFRGTVLEALMDSLVISCQQKGKG